MAATRTVISNERKRAIRLWCRRRAEGKSALARRVLPLRYAGRTHQQIRLDLGLTVERYRKVKRWLADSVAESNASDAHLSVEDALREHADRQVELVMRLGELREQGATRQQIREHLGLTEDGLLATEEWWLDALAATEEHGDENGI